MDRWGDRDWVPAEFDERGMTRWGWMVQGRDSFICGARVDIGAFTYINAQRGVEIGDDVEIGSHCSIYSRSTIDHKEGPVRILSGARIGAHSVVMPGVIIGESAIVGACSFVNRNVPAGAVVYGVPAKQRDDDAADWHRAMRSYFDDEQHYELLK